MTFQGENVHIHPQALEERLKQEQREEVHALKEAHRRTLDILRQQSDQELQTLRFELEDEGKAKLGEDCMQNLNLTALNARTATRFSQMTDVNPVCSPVCMEGEQRCN